MRCRVEVSRTICMIRDLTCPRRPDTEDDIIDLSKNQCSDFSRTTQEDTPQDNDSWDTVFPRDIDAENRWDNKKICPQFMCKMNENEICSNSYAVVYEHPCVRRACAFYGNCYACEKETCDNRGQYTLPDKISRFL